MSEEEPEAEDWLGKDVEHSIGNNFSIKPDNAATISDTPDAGGC